MKQLNEIRSDLQNIRYYYSRKDSFDRIAAIVGKNAVCNLADKYNTAIQSAPPRLYDLYANLYVMNNTQESFAYDLSSTPQTIQTQHSLLLQFLQEKITE